MKKYYSNFLFFILTIYCVILIFTEINVSQDFARNFFTDIQGEVPFFAINTSLSVCLLAATALMFGVILAIVSPNQNNANEIKFYRSQVLLFAYLALDDRFLIHEYLGHVLGINDALIILSLGIIEIGLIATWGNYSRWHKSTKNNLLKAAICFGFMVAIDGLLPREMIPRLSLEDLSKTWANTFLFLLSWSIFSQKITALKAKARSSSNTVANV